MHLRPMLAEDFPHVAISSVGSNVRHDNPALHVLDRHGVLELLFASENVSLLLLFPFALCLPEELGPSSLDPFLGPGVREAEVEALFLQLDCHDIGIQLDRLRLLDEVEQCIEGGRKHR